MDVLKMTTQRIIKALPERKIIKKSSDKINASTVLKKFKKNDSEE